MKGRLCCNIRITLDNGSCDENPVDRKGKRAHGAAGADRQSICTSVV